MEKFAGFAGDCDSPRWLIGSSDSKFVQFLGNLRSVIARLDLFFDVKDLAVFANKERPAKRHSSVVVDDTVGRCHRAIGIAEDRIV